MIPQIRMSSLQEICSYIEKLRNSSINVNKFQKHLVLFEESTIGKTNRLSTKNGSYKPPRLLKFTMAEKLDTESCIKIRLKAMFGTGYLKQCNFLKRAFIICCRLRSTKLKFKREQCKLLSSLHSFKFILRMRKISFNVLWVVNTIFNSLHWE